MFDGELIQLRSCSISCHSEVVESDPARLTRHRSRASRVSARFYLPERGLHPGCARGSGISPAEPSPRRPDFAAWLACQCSATGARLERSAVIGRRARDVHGTPDRDAQDLRRPGGDRDREHAAVQRAADASDLTESLEQQTATSEILRVISQSQRDVQPVFDTIAANARKLCEAAFAVVYTFDGRLIHVAAAEGYQSGGARGDSPQSTRCDRAAAVPPPAPILTRAVVYVPDVREDPDYDLGPGSSGRVSLRSCCAYASRRQPNWSDHRHGRRTRDVLRPADRHAPDLRRPGGDRDREHAAVQRAADPQPRPDRIAGAADGDQRDPARDQPVAA